MEETTNIMIRIDKDSKKKLKVLAAEKDITMSQLIRRSIKKFIRDAYKEKTYPEPL